MKTLTITAAFLLALPLAAEAGTSAQRSTSAGKRPAATYTAAGSNSGGNSQGSAGRQTHSTQRPVQVQPAYTPSAPRSSGTTASSSNRFQFTEVAPRSLY